MEKRILVIGATGLLGEPVAKGLVKNGYKVRLMVREQTLNLAKARFDNCFEIVPGDISDPGHVGRALEDCFGVHINLSGDIEQIGAENVASVAKILNLKRITYISGTSVAEETSWVPLIKRKFLAEKAILGCGVPYTIFCPTWFMEVLPKYIRGNRAIVFGKQPNPYHLIAAEDYARMVAASYGREEAINKRLIIHGPEGILFHEAVKRYCHAFHPEIRKVSTMPYWLATIVASLKRQKAMKAASDFMAAFEKIGERGAPSEANNILGAPRIKLEEWLRREKNKG